MTAIGETLRRERQRRNLELEDVARELKISHRFLEAIEEERFDALPRGVFAKSFVRQYARLLGLDEDELANEVQRAVEPSSDVPGFAGQAPSQPVAEIRVPRVEAWENVSDSRTGRSSSLPALALVVVVMLVCSGVYAYWQRAHRPAPPHDDSTAQTQPNRLPHNEPAPPTPAPPVEATQPAVQSSQTPVQTAVVNPQPQATAPPAAPATSPSTAAPPQDSAPRVQVPPSNPNAPVRVAVTAEELVWVLARTDGKFAFSGTLEANQTRTFDGNSVMIRLGNAGGVTITLNGQPIGAVGPKGQVRTVQFTPGGFQVVAVPKPSLPLNDLL